jgi:hypothetical protein
VPARVIRLTRPATESKGNSRPQERLLRGALAAQHRIASEGLESFDQGLEPRTSSAHLGEEFIEKSVLFRIVSREIHNRTLKLALPCPLTVAAFFLECFVAATM